MDVPVRVVITSESAFSKTYGVKWADLDPNEHVRHSVYDEYADDTRVRWMEQIGYPPARFSESGFGPVIVRQQAHFYREVTIGDSITVTLRLASLSPSGATWKMEHDIVKSCGEKAAELRIEGTWLNRETRKPMAPPDELLQLLEALARRGKHSHLSDGSGRGQETLQ